MNSVYSEYYVKLYTIFIIAVYNIMTLIEMVEMILGAYMALDFTYRIVTILSFIYQRRWQ